MLLAGSDEDAEIDKLTVMAEKQIEVQREKISCTKAIEEEKMGIMKDQEERRTVAIESVAESIRSTMEM